jgi:teichuronic acid biosynthesis glycosyltransferase TuaC
MIRVLYLSRNFPNPVLPRLGMWVERMLRACQDRCDFKVISPVPYAPPLPGLSKFTRFRKIEPRRWDQGVEIFHPKFLTGPAHWLYGLEGATQHWAAVRAADEIRRDFPFELIHAHFIYPDGVIAARLGQRYGVPVVISDHALWRPWMDDYPRVRRKAVWAAQQCSFHLAVSRAARESIAHFTGESEKLRIIPNVVDGKMFIPPTNGARPAPNRILFVGIMRQVKGVDILLEALRRLADQNRDVRLAIVGESFYESYRRDLEGFRQMVTDLRLQDRVEFLGGKEPAEVAKEMQRSALLVLPSRRESFGAVLAEALACGTPVVATRCGGPEDIVNDQVGVLVPPEDPAALAEGIAQVLDRRASYDPARLRAYALENFGMEAVGSRIVALYREALGEGRTTS